MAADDHVRASVKGVPRFGVLRVCDRVQATATRPITSALTGAPSRIVTHYHFTLSDRLLHTEYVHVEPRTWEEVLASSDAVTVLRWRAALSGLAFGSAVLIVVLIILGFAMEGLYAIAAAYALGFSVAGAAMTGLIALLYTPWANT